MKRYNPQNTAVELQEQALCHLPTGPGRLLLVLEFRPFGDMRSLRSRSASRVRSFPSFSWGVKQESTSLAVSREPAPSPQLTKLEPICQPTPKPALGNLSQLNSYALDKAAAGRSRVLVRVQYYYCGAVNSLQEAEHIQASDDEASPPRSLSPQVLSGERGGQA